MKKIDYSNQDNMIKTLFPEFVTISKLGPMGQLPTFAEGNMSRTIAEGVTPKGHIPPIHQHFLFVKGLNNGRRT